MMTQSLNTTSKKSSPPPYNATLITRDHSPEQLHKILCERGCNSCNLGSQPELVSPVIYKGNIHAPRMIIGEYPSLNDTPAGTLLEKILLSVDYNPTKDFIFTNAILCRPIAPVGSEKQNLMPTMAQKKVCRPYVEQVMNWVKPNLVMLLGFQAVKSIIPKETVNKNMENLVGQVITSTRYPNILFFVMWHPSFLCRQQNTDNWEHYRQLTWKHINLFKQIDGELNDTN